MCGIVGYTGNNPAADLIINSLELLEYRGYDSAGLALKDPETGDSLIRKCAGRVKDLDARCEFDRDRYTCGIGHTRWATHGGVTDENAHPHHVGNVTLVHNGIITNYMELAERFGLTDSLISETDSEVVAGVLNHFYKGDPIEALRQTEQLLSGTFALVVMFKDIPDTIFATRNVSPIVAAYIDGGTMLASDVNALGGLSQNYAPVPESTILTLRKDTMELTDMQGSPLELDFIDIGWDTTIAGKGNHPFYMIKEILDQPDALSAIIDARTKDGVIDLSCDNVPDAFLKDFDNICAIACGTALHAGLVARSVIQSRFRIRMDVECASEFIYANPLIDERTLVVVISQSGETIDTLKALRYAKERGAKSIGVINVRGSSIARESDHVIYTDAGPEIAVASTKAFTTQTAALLLLIGRIAKVRGLLDPAAEQRYVKELQKVPQSVVSVLDRRDDIHHIARQILEARDTFMIGRGMDYTILLEGALKLKEVSYIHTEAYASGELKHGTIALITEEAPVIALVTQENLVDKEVSNIKEVQSRNAKVTAFIREDLTLGTTGLAEVFLLPRLADDFMVFPSAAALQLLAYYVSADRGYDVDKPRNLAKVVTVE